MEKEKGMKNNGIIEERKEKKKRRQVEEGREEGVWRDVRDVMRCLGKGWEDEMKKRKKKNRNKNY